MNLHSNFKFAQRYVCPFPRLLGGERSEGAIGNITSHLVGVPGQPGGMASCFIRVTCMVALIKEMKNGRLAR